MQTPVAPRAPSASTALSVAGGRPPRRRRGGQVAVVIGVVVLIAGIGGAGYALREPLDSLIEDLGLEDGAETKDVDEAHERVAVTTELGGGLRWTMQKRPTEEERESPASLDGDTVTMTTWTTTAGLSAEVVGLFERRPEFDLDATVRGIGMLYNGEVVDVSTADIGGHPARTAVIDGLDPQDRGANGTGRVTLVTTETTVVMVLAFGNGSDASDIHDQHQILVDSLVFG